MSPPEAKERRTYEHAVIASIFNGGQRGFHEEKRQDIMLKPSLHPSSALQRLHFIKYVGSVPQATYIFHLC